MSIGICINCKRNMKLIRLHCSACYNKLKANGKILKIEKPILPTNLTTIQNEIMIGSLLGDGCLYTENIEKFSPSLYIRRKSEDLKYLEYEFLHLKEFCLGNIYYFQKFDERTQKTYDGYGFGTRRCEAFVPYYKEWYPEDKKIIPKTLILTPLICAIWFCDDGCIIAGNRLRIKLSTHGFSSEDTKWLISYLSELLEEHFSIVYDDEHAFIVGSDAAAKAYISYISDYIPVGMERKITWSEENFSSPRQRPYLKNRYSYDLNDKERSILLLLNSSNLEKSSLEICKEIGWMNTNNKIPSSYNRYLNKFLKENWITPIKLIINGKSNTKYKITNSGRIILDAALSFVERKNII